LQFANVFDLFDLIYLQSEVWPIIFKNANFWNIVSCTYTKWNCRIFDSNLIKTKRIMVFLHRFLDSCPSSSTNNCDSAVGIELISICCKSKALALYHLQVGLRIGFTVRHIWEMPEKAQSEGLFIYRHPDTLLLPRKSWFSPETNSLWKLEWSESPSTPCKSNLSAISV